MQPVLTVTLNPSLDLATAVAEMRPGPKLRCSEPALDPGGGGINVARAIHILGGDATAFVTASGPTGQRLVRLLQAEGVPLALFDGPGETRQSLAVTDQATGGQFRLMLPGPSWTRARSDAALRRITEVTPQGGLVVLSGSLPPGMAVDFPLRLARKLESRGAELILDTSAEALERAAQARDLPFAVLRMDQDEAEALAGRTLQDRAASADFAQSLVQAGVARMVIVARGSDGSTMATHDSRLHASGVPVAVQSRVGAGDSFLAAFTLALAQGDGPGQALRRGSAAAAAAVMTPGTRLCTRRDATRLLRQVALSEP